MSNKTKKQLLLNLPYFIAGLVSVKSSCPDTRMCSSCRD